jgi:Endosomal/lysosomal potassium channel TMEM175
MSATMAVGDVRRHDDPLVPFDRKDLRPRRPGCIRPRVRHRTRSRAARLLQRRGLRHRRHPADPGNPPPEDTRHLLHGLAALWPSYLAYAITFLLIGQVWANHHVMDIAFLPFAAGVLSAAFGTGHGQRTAVVLHGMTFLLAAMLFNLIWEYARRDHRLLGTTIDSVGASAVSRRFRLALVWLATGTLLGALLLSSAWR